MTCWKVACESLIVKLVHTQRERERERERERDLLKGGLRVIDGQANRLTRSLEQHLTASPRLRKMLVAVFYMQHLQPRSWGFSNFS